MPARITVAASVVLDGRLALFHKRQRWLAVSDLHFGYEVSQRASGKLFPLCGMQTIKQRLNELLQHYRPQYLVLLGDIVHDPAGRTALPALIERLEKFSQVVLIAGNHDRSLSKHLTLVDSWRSDNYLFHHGHYQAEPSRYIQIIGHHHPAGTIRDGAGLRLKLPAFVQEDNRWILPAFSPWAAGTEWRQTRPARVWLCSPQRILRLDESTSIERSGPHVERNGARR